MLLENLINEIDSAKLGIDREGQGILIVLAGAPASGKSTWLKEFGDGDMIISRDNIVDYVAAKENISYQDTFEKYPRSSKKSKAINRLVDMRAINGFRTGKDVVIDMTNLVHSYIISTESGEEIEIGRKKWLDMADEYGYKKVGVYFEVSLSELDKRGEERRKKTGKFIPHGVVGSMYNSYVRPSKEEGFDLIFRGSSVVSGIGMFVDKLKRKLFK